MKFFKKKERSIRTQTLIYFMILVAAMISLLWGLQEWFFSTQMIRLRQRELVRSIENYTENFNYFIDDYPVFLNNLYDLSVKNNLLIYCFTYKGQIFTDLSETDTLGRRLKTFSRGFGSFTDQNAISPFISKDQRARQFPWDKVDGDKITQSDFIYLIDAEGDWEQNTQWEYSAERNKLYYATGHTLETGSRFYVYAEGVITTGDVAASAYRVTLIMVTLVCLLLTIVFSLLLSQLLAHPISKISKEATKLASGDFTTRFNGSAVKEINDLAQGLNYAAEEFSKTEQLRRDFLANISHDLRTPLTLIRGYAELIRDLPQPAFENKEDNKKAAKRAEKQIKQAEVIIEESRRLAELVEDIQRFSRLQSGTDTVKEAEFDLKPFLESMANHFAGVHNKNDYQFIYECKEKDLIVNADADKIRQVMYNLISNAMNYTDKEKKRVVIKAYKEKDKAVVEVIDNGKGIAPEELDLVWERYYRSNQQKRTVVGSGLGLSIVKGILTAHKAEFGVKSELGKGTAFWFKLDII